MRSSLQNVNEKPPVTPEIPALSDDQCERLNDALESLRSVLVPTDFEAQLDALPDDARHEIEAALTEELDEASYDDFFADVPRSRAQTPLVHFDNDGWRTFTAPWRAMFIAAGVTMAKDAGSSADTVVPFKINDALFIGGDLPQKVLDLPMKLGFGRGRDDKRWPGKAMPFSAVLGLLSKNEVGEKDGKAFIQGTAIGNERKAKAMEGMWIAGLDLDSGIFPDPIGHKIQNDLKLTSVIYTTHSHNSTETHVVQNSFAQWSRKHHLDEVPTTDTMRRYMQQAKKWEPWVVETIELAEEPVHTKDGISYVLTHDPMPKFRVIFPLAQPFIIAKQKLSQQDAINLWKGRLLGLAKILGVPIDEACLDPSRLFYLARRREGRDFQIIVTSGEALDFDKVPSIDTRSRTKPDDNVFAQAAKELGSSDGADLVFNGFSLKRWAKTTADSFDAAGMIRAACPDKIRSDDGQDKLEIECPFDYEHGNAGDTDDRACYVWSAHAGSTEDAFKWGCRHNSCSGRTRLDFVCEALRAGWFTTADLENESYRIVTVDDDEEDDLPFPYVLIDDKIHFETTTGKKTTAHFVCDAFKVVGESRDESDDNRALLIEFTSKGKRHVERIPFGELQVGSNAIRERLAKKGLTIHAGRESKSRFDGLLSILSAKKQYLTVSRPGFYVWENETVFVSPTGKAIGRDGARDDVSLVATALLKNPHPRGTFDGWRQSMEAIANAGLPHLVLGAASGFVGPLIVLAEADTSGVIFVGPTSKGKTIAQGAGAGVWADPNPKLGRGLFRSARSTDNGLESRAALSHATIMSVDDLGGNTDPKTIGQIIFMIDGGTSKERLRADTSVRDVKFWKMFYTLSAEKTTAELIRSAGRTMLGGHAVRLPSITVPEDTRDLTPDELKAITGFQSNYGVAWEPYIRCLFSAGYVERPEAIRERLDACIGELCDASSKGAERRAALPFAWLWLGGEIARDADILPANMPIESSVRAAWASYLASAEAESLAPGALAIENVAKNINLTWGVEIIPLGSNAPVMGIGDPCDTSTDDDAKPRYRAPKYGWYDEETIYIVPGALAELAGGETSERTVAQALRKAGVLQMYGEKYLNPYLPGRPLTKHYRLKLAALSEAGDEETDD